MQDTAAAMKLIIANGLDTNNAIIPAIINRASRIKYIRSLFSAFIIMTSFFMSKVRFKKHYPKSEAIIGPT